MISGNFRCLSSLAFLCITRLITSWRCTPVKPKVWVEGKQVNMTILEKEKFCDVRFKNKRLWQLLKRRSFVDLQGQQDCSFRVAEAAHNGRGSQQKEILILVPCAFTCGLEIALVLPLNYSCCHWLWLTGDAVQWRMHNLKTGTCYNALVEARLLRICLAYVMKSQSKPLNPVPPLASNPQLNPHFGNLLLISHKCFAPSRINQIKPKPELKMS